MNKQPFFSSAHAQALEFSWFPAMRFLSPWLLAMVLLLPLSGCSSLGQGFGEKTHRTEYSEPDENGDQYVTAEEKSKIKMKDRAILMPFNTEADKEHDLVYEVTKDGWWLSMGAYDIIKGGDISAALAELKGLMAEVKETVALLNPATSAAKAVTGIVEMDPTLEPLEEP